MTNKAGDLGSRLVGALGNREGLDLLRATVTAVDSVNSVVSIDLADTVLTNIRYLNSYIPIIDDIVEVLLIDGDPIVIGSLAPSSSWQDYTPEWIAGTTNPTLGNGTLLGRYFALPGGLVTVKLELVIGSTTALGTGVWGFSLPLTGSGNYEVGSAISRNASTDIEGISERYSTTHMRIRMPSGGSGESEVISATNPFAWATDGYLRASLTYESA